MKQLVFLLEEESMRVVLEHLLPRVLPPGIEFLAVPHEGKADLRKAIPNKLAHWHRAPGDSVGFVIVHDRDSADCHTLKDDLTRLCQGRGDWPVLIRIPCPELESWYLGDLKAVEDGLGVAGLRHLQDKRRYRVPDSVANPKQELNRLVGEQGQIRRASAIAPRMDIEANRSRSFRVFVSGVRRLASELA